MEHIVGGLSRAEAATEAGALSTGARLRDGRQGIEGWCSLGGTRVLWRPSQATGGLCPVLFRRIAEHLTPSDYELDARCAVMDRLRALAQTGISFCLGLDLEPYGRSLVQHTNSQHAS